MSTIWPSQEALRILAMASQLISKQVWFIQLQWQENLDKSSDIAYATHTYIIQLLYLNCYKLAKSLRVYN